MLPVDFQDDILAESMNGRRKYQMITNSDGTVSFVDVTEYKQVGSNFGQAQVNATNEAVNESADKNKIIDDKDDLVANSQAGMMAGALAVKAIREELNQKMSFEIIPWNDLTLSKITLINETYGFLKSGNMVYGQCYFIANENINSYTAIISGLPEIKKLEGGMLWSAPDNKPIGLALYQQSGNIQNAIALTEGQQYLLSVQGIL